MHSFIQEWCFFFFTFVLPAVIHIFYINSGSKVLGRAHSALLGLPDAAVPFSSAECFSVFQLILLGVFYVPQLYSFGSLSLLSINYS